MALVGTDRMLVEEKDRKDGKNQQNKLIQRIKSSEQTEDALR